MEDVSLSLQIQQPTQPPPPPSHPQHSAVLHSVRKAPAKPWKRPEPPPPKTYLVHPRGFRKLVQKLTGDPKRRVKPNVVSNPRPLRDTLRPPPPLDLAPRRPPPPILPPSSSLAEDLAPRPLPPPTLPPSSSLADRSSTGMILSPSLCSPYARWCSFPLLSPGTMASLELSNSPISLSTQTPSYMSNSLV